MVRKKLNPRESEYSRNLTNSRLVEHLGLSEDDYDLIEKAFGMGSDVRVINLIDTIGMKTCVSLDVLHQWTDIKGLKDYLDRKGINTSLGRFARKEDSDVYYEQGKVRLIARGIPF